MNLQQCVAIIVAAQMTLGMAAAPAIGVATARGAFRVNDAAMRGNGTLFSGARVETASAPGDLALISGERLTLGANSSAQVFSDHLVLERGESRIANSVGAFGVEASMLRIVADEPGAEGRVTMGAGTKILVASTAGRLHVSTAAGIPLAAISAGRALEFDTRSSNTGTMLLTGRMSRRDGKLFVTDETTELTVELRQGRMNLQAVEKSVGKRVEVAGLHIPNSMPIALEVQAVGAAQAANGAGAGTGAGTAGAGTAGAGAGSTGAAAGAAGAGAAGAAGGGATVAGLSIGTIAAVGAGVAATAGVAAGIAVTRNDTPKISGK